MIKRTAAALATLAAALALTACGSQDQPEAQPVGQQIQAADLPSVQPSSEPVTSVDIDETAEPIQGVSVFVTAGSQPGTYAVQFQASPSFAGEWAVPLSAFTGTDASGGTLHVVESQWPANPVVSSSASIMGGTLTFDEPITALIYTSPDGSVLSWSVS